MPVTTNEMTTHFTTSNDGVETDEVGVITGEVELACTTTDDGDANAKIRYKDADEWYTVTNAARKLSSPVELPIYHTTLLGQFNQQP